MLNEPEDKERVIAEVGGLVDETGVCLGVYGPDLDPDQVTSRIGCAPTSAHRRGDRQGPRSPPYKEGAWLLEARGRAPTSAEQLIRQLLSKVPLDEALWEDLNSRFVVQLRIAVHFTGWNKGFDLTSGTVAAIAGVATTIVFDLYGYGEEDA